MESGVIDTCVTISTAALPDRDRDSIARDFHGRICMRLDLEPLDDHGLRFTAATTVMPGVRASRGKVAPMAWERTKALLTDGNDDLLICWVETGCGVDRRGRETVQVEAGGPCIVALEEAWRIRAPEGGTTACVQLSRRLLEPLVKDVGGLTPGAIAHDTPEARLLLDYVSAVNSTPPRPALGAMASIHIADLVAVAIGPTADAAHTATGRGVRMARLRAVKQHIQENLGSPRLSAETAGRSLGLSARYIRRLFAEDGAGFSDYVTERRLDRIRRRLGDPRYACRTIADIAFEVGLVEPSTFYRQFKARYGMRPSEARFETPPWSQD